MPRGVVVVDEEGEDFISESSSLAVEGGAVGSVAERIA